MEGGAFGHHAQAVDCYQHAVTLYHNLGNRYSEATTLTRLGDTHYAAGQPDAACATWTDALSILADLDHPDTEAVRAKLATLDQTPLPPADPGTGPPACSP